MYESLKSIESITFFVCVLASEKTKPGVLRVIRARDTHDLVHDT